MRHAINTQQHVGLLFGSACAFGAHLACDFAEVIEHLGDRQHQRGAVAVVEIGIAIAVVHPGANLWVVFCFRHFNLFILRQQFADGFAD